MNSPTYALITPARDEAANLRRLARCVLEQTVRPQAWIVVDNGSADDTPRLVDELSRAHDWIIVASASAGLTAEPGAPVVRAFHAGLEQLAEPADVVVKLDADVSIDPDYFERLLAAFAADSALGIASGTCYEQRDGTWRATHVTGGHVRGATRAYRWQCLRDVLPLEERVGWDGIDALKANVLGWRTQTIADLRFYHHRALGERDGGSYARWARQGNGARYMGYRLPYLVLRALHHARRNPAALAMLWGYACAALRREPRCSDESVRAYLRRQQSLRNLPRRAREALGKHA